jgi:hypothetical protein
MAIIQGEGTVFENLRARKKLGKQGIVNIGFSAPYAVYVHEDMEAIHPNGQAKFLEQPATIYRKQMISGIAHRVSRGQPLDQALLEVGTFLLEEAKRLVPVDTGFLRDSGFVVAGVEGGAPVPAATPEGAIPLMQQAGKRQREHGHGR